MNEAIVPRRKYNYYGIFSCDSTTKPQKNEDDIGEAKAAYFRAAESMSFLSDHRCRLGCVIVKGHRIISSGHNSASKRHSLQAKIDTQYFRCDCSGFVHAEVDALIPLIDQHIDLTQASIYVYRSTCNGKGMARPCPRCIYLIKKVGIRKVNYTTPDGFVEEVLTL